MDDSIELKIDVTYKMPSWPNYLTGLHGSPSMNVGELTDEQIQQLCDRFSEHCRAQRPFEFAAALGG